jgi:predicted dehydrogenase
MRKLRLGIIGSGFGQYGLFPALRSLKNAEVVALAGKKRPQLLEYCQLIGFTNIYTDWKEMLEKEELDAVAIAVTPNAQYEITKVAIRKGLHIFAEKPLAANLKQAKEMKKLADKAKITTTVDFLFPEINEWLKAKEMIDKKVLGKLRHLSVHWDFLSYDVKHKKKTWKFEPTEGGGALSFYFSHGLHYLEHFAGTIEKFQSQERGEVGADILFTTKHGITGDAHINADSAGIYRHELIFSCERGTIILRNSHLPQVTQFTLSTVINGKEKIIRVPKDKTIPGEDERAKLVRKLAKRFVTASLAHEPMSPSFKEGLRVQELIDAIRKASK